MKNLDLPEGLKFIGEGAFENCPSIQSIYIPSTVREIHPKAFEESSNLAIRFCDEIEMFVTEASFRDWWNNGVSRHSLRTYTFLVQRNIPARLSMLTVRESQTKIRNMLMLIPSFDLGDSFVHFPLEHYLDSIDSKLAIYASVPDIALLELALWKSRILQQDDPVNENLLAMRKQCRRNCGACIVIPNVLVFLLTTESLHILQSDRE